VNYVALMSRLATRESIEPHLRAQLWYALE
jgi:hypothetical protein